MVDLGRLEDLLRRLDREVALLADLAAYDRDRIRDEPQLQYTAQRGLEIAIQICLDVAQHIIASEGLATPKDYAGAFAALGEAAWLPPDLAAAFQDAARFRNLLVHLYDDVDEERVVDILTTRLGDFERFRTAIAGRVAGP